MKSEVIAATKREIIGKQVKQLRRDGFLPGVVYGAGLEPTAIQFDEVEASRVLVRTSGSTLLDLKVDGESHQVIVRDIQRDVITRRLLHVDLLKVAMDVKIRTEVPIELVGEAPAVKEIGGLLVTGISMLEVEALPSDLVDRVSVDLEVLKEIDDTILIEDLAVSGSITILSDPSELVARVIYQAEEIIEEEEIEEIELLEEEEPEVIERGKREEVPEPAVSEEGEAETS
jgi:large subunit ribosomal protein L25